jgi:hypothetical protein
MTQQLTQRIHENEQITRVDQILVGRTYITKYEIRSGKILEIAEHTITGVNYSTREFHTALSINPNITNIHSMSNYGIVPNQKSNWNQTDWLVLKN